MRVIFGVGHLSNFGMEVLRNVLDHPYFQIDTIVIADCDRWIFFEKKLAPNKRFSLRSFKKTYKRKTREVQQLLQAGKKEINIISVGNMEELKEKGIAEKGYYLFTAAYPQIFSKALLNAFDGRAVNFHPSYLPRCRGADPVYWTIATREDFGGISSHFMLPQIDTGPIIARLKIAFNPQQITYDLLYGEVYKHIFPLLDEMETFFKNNQEAIPQEDKDATYFRQNTRIHHRIYWGKESMEELCAKIRAGSALAYLDTGQELNFLPPVNKVALVNLSSEEAIKEDQPGMIVKKEGAIIYVRCLDGYIKSRQALKKNKWSRLWDKIPGLNLFASPFLAISKIKVGTRLH